MISKKIKVIFLDVDGVLNSVFSRDNDEIAENWMENEVSNWHLIRLKRIVEETGAKLVLSSSWRLGHPIIAGTKVCKDALVQVLIDKLDVFGLEIMDCTPVLDGKWRGTEIAEWLKVHSEVEKFVILDDDTDFLPEQQKFFVRTTYSNGLTDELADKAIEILNN